MKVWPVPDSFTKNLPGNNKAGSFWEDRGDRHHCGVDIYAPVGSDVVATESGIVVKTGVFTSPKMNPYWNITYFVVLKHDTGLLSKYAELLDVTVSDGESLESGQVLGHIGCVLDVEKITGESFQLFLVCFVIFQQERKKHLLMHHKHELELRGNFQSQLPMQFEFPSNHIQKVLLVSNKISRNHHLINSR